MSTISSVPSSMNQRSVALTPSMQPKKPEVPAAATVNNKQTPKERIKELALRASLLSAGATFIYYGAIKADNSTAIGKFLSVFSVVMGSLPIACGLMPWDNSGK